MRKSNIFKTLRTIGECLMFLVLATGAWYLLEMARKRPDGCQDKQISEIGACDASGYCGVAYDDGTKGFQQLPVKGFGYTVCPEKHK